MPQRRGGYQLSGLGASLVSYGAAVPNVPIVRPFPIGTAPPPGTTTTPAASTAAGSSTSSNSCFDPAIQTQYFPKVDNTDGFNQAALTFFQQAVCARSLPPYTQNNCQVSASSTSSMVATTVGSSLLKASALVPGPWSIVTAAAGGIADIFGAIFGAHAQKTAESVADLCQIVPVTNQYLAQTTQQVQAGQLTAAQAASQLQSIVSQFQTVVAPIMKDSSTANNEAGGYYRALQGIVAQLNEDYALLEQQAAAAASGTGSASSAGSSISSAISSLTSGSVLPWLLGGGLLLLLL